MTLKISKRIKSIAISLFLSFLMMGIFPMHAMAGPLGGTGYKIEGDNHGLEISTDTNHVDMGNLNPGDNKYSSLILTNTGKKSLTVYIRTNIISENTQNSGYLADVMQLTIKDGDTVITNKLFRAAASEGNIKIGRMAAGAEKTLDFYVNLPGEKTGNEYQGASMKVNWTFTTTTSSSGGGGSNNRENPSEPQNPDTINEEPIPPGPDEETPVDPDVKIMEDGEVSDGPGMPRTGEPSLYYYYGAGALITALGFAARRK